jgi:hypothetical protein
MRGGERSSAVQVAEQHGTNALDSHLETFHRHRKILAGHEPAGRRHAVRRGSIDGGNEAVMPAERWVSWR